MLRIGVVVLVLATISQGQRAQIEVGRYYQVESSDGSFLTIGGGNSGKVKVVTEMGQGTNPRQKFQIGKGDTHDIKPEAQNAISSLVLDLEMPSNLVYQQLKIPYRRNQWWKITSLETNKYVIQNDRSGHCMTSDGINTQVYTTICDLGNANQTWIFTPV